MAKHNRLHHQSGAARLRPVPAAARDSAVPAVVLVNGFGIQRPRPFSARRSRTGPRTRTGRAWSPTWAVRRDPLREPRTGGRRRAPAPSTRDAGCAGAPTPGGCAATWACSGNIPMPCPGLRRRGCAALLYGYMLNLDGATDVAAAAGRFHFAAPQVSIDEIPRRCRCSWSGPGATRRPGSTPPSSGSSPQPREGATDHADRASRGAARVRHRGRLAGDAPRDQRGRGVPAPGVG